MLVPGTSGYGSDSQNCGTGTFGSDSSSRNWGTYLTNFTFDFDFLGAGT